VTGLTSGTEYTFTVTATNAAGVSAASSASPPVVPWISTPPDAPTGVWATEADARALVSWTAPASDGRSALTGYTVRVANGSSQVGGLHPVAAGTTSLNVTGLTNGIAYTFQVLASNAVGSSAYASVSSAMKLAPTAAVTRLSDFNRDGFTDVIARDSGGVLWLYPGDGAGGFRSRRSMGAGWRGLTQIITPGDVTGDGKADVFGRTTAGALWLFPGNGASGLGTKRQIGAGWQSFRISSAADMTGDGRADLLACDSSGRLWLYPLAGNAVFQARRLVGAGWNVMSSIVGSGDFSGDHRADILARNTSGALYLYRGNGAGGIGSGTLVSTGWSTMTALVGNGNWNRALGNDLLARDSAGTMWLYPGDNAGHFGLRHAIGSGWQVLNYVG
jgi:hypothetical protein